MAGNDSFEFNPTFGAYVEKWCSEVAFKNSMICKNKGAIISVLETDGRFKLMFYVLTAILIVVGTVLNLISLYCFLKINKRHSTNVYLTVLSLVDTINLHVNFTLPLLRQSEVIDTTFRSCAIFCRVTGVLTEFFLIYPTWIIILLTMEPIIYMISPEKRHTSQAQRRAKISVIILALIVFLLSIYRLVDLHGIDQVSIFSVMACNGTDHPLHFMRLFNLFIWSILPEFLTLFLSLIIIYRIKLAKRLKEDHSKVARARYNQATKTVLLISTLFLIFHTPTGVMIGLNLFYSSEGLTLRMAIIFVSRRLTVLLYEISLCCKFFIYQRTFQDFKNILSASRCRFHLRRDSRILGQHIPINPPGCAANHQVYHFVYKGHSAGASQGSQSDSLLKSNDENTHRRPHHRTRPMNSINQVKVKRETVSLCINGTKTTPVTNPCSNRVSADTHKSSTDARKAFYQGRTQLSL